MLEIIDVPSEDVAALTLKQEGHFLDFKDKRISPGKLTRSLAAFCNSDGGDLYVGIAEESGKFTWSGFADPEDANGHIQAFEAVSPFGEDLTGEFLRTPGLDGLVLHVNARKSRFVRSDSESRVYKRVGAQNLPVSSEESILALRRQKGLESFEEETVAVALSEVTNSLPILEYLVSAVPTAEPEVYLRGQYLIHGQRPTVAAVLLFAEQPQAALPKRCGIKIYRYSSEEMSRDRLVQDPITVEGHLYAQVYSAVEKTVRLISEAAFLSDDGLRTVAYPAETLHEIITNAVLHRDYSVTDDVHVRIYENRVEVESPGRLPGHITPANILSERLSRNPFVVRHLNRFPDPPNKDVGEGLDTAFEFMRKLNLKQPEILEREHSVLVVIRHESLASPAQQVVDHLNSNESIRNQQARKLTGVLSESRMQKIFEDLIAANEIEHVPGTAGRGYAYRRKRS
ncbi:ATP-binding protein [Cellulomonas iranensis]|uniref:ATP-dependent DNA helicase RecG n=1 Tax=Cellulomonas iranensis TaxID=76862 RepID=A0ABU0GG35_9CELL|nr:ATP-binding protein [Cellulomonas iranensis]MDQ0423894.1 ATP-dependent DNA helicase RecG [Cellulomonas iranensis]